MISSKFVPFHMTICQIMSDYGMLYIFFTDDNDGWLHVSEHFIPITI